MEFALGLRLIFFNLNASKHRALAFFLYDFNKEV